MKAEQILSQVFASLSKDLAGVKRFFLGGIGRAEQGFTRINTNLHEGGEAVASVLAKLLECACLFWRFPKRWYVPVRARSSHTPRNGRSFWSAPVFSGA